MINLCAGRPERGLQQQPPNRVRRTRAIVEQGRTIGIARIAHVLFEGADQVVQQLCGQRMGACGAGQRVENVGPAGGGRLAGRGGEVEADAAARKVSRAG